MAGQIRIGHKKLKVYITTGLVGIVTVLFIFSIRHTNSAGEDFIYANHADDVAYVGMETCASCHQDKHATFIHTGMGLSFDAASPQKSSALFGENHQVYDSFTGMHYYPFWREDTLFVREYSMVDNDTIHQLDWAINYIVGSGQHTNSHIIEQNGYLYQAPITFYVQKQRWDLAPGFENGNNSRFNRILNDECISCHNSMPKLEKASQFKFTQIGNGIDCERCHGPGELHVEQRKQGLGVDVAKEIDPTIVNPSKLSWERQIDLCQRCHLQGLNVLKEGKKFTDFKPGMKLSKVFDIYLPRYKGENSKLDMANHSQRFQMSNCFISSNKDELQFTCISCHNPHLSVKITGTEVYNTACAQCHSKKECSANEVELLQASHNCVSCHMPPSSSEDIPHVSVHDHYIRVPDKSPKEVEQIQQLVGLYAVNNPKPDLEYQILAYLEYWEKFDKNPFYLSKAEELLKSSDDKKLQLKFFYLKELYQEATKLSFKYNSLNAWQNFMLGECYGKLNQYSQALFYLQKAYDLEPTNPQISAQLLNYLIVNSKLIEAEQLGEELCQEFENNAQLLNRLARVYLLRKKRYKAKHYLDRAYKQDPLDISIWLTYVNFYLQSQDIKNTRLWLDRIVSEDESFLNKSQLAEILDNLNDFS